MGYEAFSRPIDGCHSPDATDAKKQDTLTFSKICTHAANFFSLAIDVYICQIFQEAAYF